METKRPISRLVLQRESLRELSRDDLRQIAAGNGSEANHRTKGCSGASKDFHKGCS